MILDYYRLREQPFGATPDSRYLFASETHREALASLLYGVGAGRGFVALIAMPGMGKTTLLFESMRQLRASTKTVFLFQTISSPLEFLSALLADLGVEEINENLMELQAKLNAILVDQARRGERLVVVIDEAQNLDDSVLEFARMLSNFETEQQKLVQIILSGQPQLAVKLASPQLMQLRQRISMIAYLKPLSTEETRLYVAHRLRVAGYKSDKPLFTSAALQLIAQHSKGIPRNINNLCFNALSLGCAMKRNMIDAGVIKEVISDLDLDPSKFLEPQVHKRNLDLSKFAPILRRSFGGWIPMLGFAGALLFVFGWILIDAIK
jgi:general secretion pathway protein A